MSTTCALCGHREAASRRSQELFICALCGNHDNADRNASLNVADRGLLYFRKRSGITLEELRLARQARMGMPAGGERPLAVPAGQPVSG